MSKFLRTEAREKYKHAWQNHQEQQIHIDRSWVMLGARSNTCLMDVGEHWRNVGQETIVIFSQWPVDEGCSSNNISPRHKTPVARVGTANTIVTQYKVVVGRNEHI